MTNMEIQRCIEDLQVKEEEEVEEDEKGPTVPKSKIFLALSEMNGRHESG